MLCGRMGKSKKKKNIYVTSSARVYLASCVSFSYLFSTYSSGLLSDSDSSAFFLFCTHLRRSLCNPFALLACPCFTDVPENTSDGVKLG